MEDNKEEIKPTEELTQNVSPSENTPSSVNSENSTPPPNNKFDSILKNKKMLVMGSVGFFVFIVILLFARLLLPTSGTNKAEPTPTNEPTLTQSPSETPNVSQSPKSVQNSTKDSVTPTAKPNSSPIPTNKPSATTTPTPTKAPTPTPASPPQVNISYPTEGQSITMDSSQTFCVVDQPVAHTQGLLRRQNTGSGWSGYDSVNTLCYSPSNGANTLELQYKNGSDLETSYTIHFNFQRN